MGDCTVGFKHAQPLAGIVLREEDVTDPDRQLAEALQAVKAAHFDADGAACDYAALAASRERGRLAACLADLAAFDPKRVRIPAQTALWVNVFNAGVLRDIPELELAASAGEVQAFFERPRLRIGGRLYSLDDVQHGLLRGNLPKNGRLRPPMLRDDPRLAYMPIAYDERIHFAMHSAGSSTSSSRTPRPGTCAARCASRPQARWWSFPGYCTGMPRTSAASAACW